MIALEPLSRVLAVLAFLPARLGAHHMRVMVLACFSAVFTNGMPLLAFFYTAREISPSLIPSAFFVTSRTRTSHLANNFPMSTLGAHYLSVKSGA